MQTFEHTPETFYADRSRAFAALVAALPKAADTNILINKRSLLTAQALTALLRAGEDTLLESLLNHQECDHWLSDYGGTRVGCAHVLAGLVDGSRRSHKQVPVDEQVTACAEMLWSRVRTGVSQACYAGRS